MNCKCNNKSNLIYSWSESLALISMVVFNLCNQSKINFKTNKQKIFQILKNKKRKEKRGISFHSEITKGTTLPSSPLFFLFSFRLNTLERQIHVPLKKISRSKHFTQLWPFWTSWWLTWLLQNFCASKVSKNSLQGKKCLKENLHTLLCINVLCPDVLVGEDSDVFSTAAFVFMCSLLF